MYRVTRLSWLPLVVVTAASCIYPGLKSGVATDAAGGIAAGGASGGRAGASVSDAPAAQPDVPMAGTTSGGVVGTTNEGGNGGRAGASVFDASAAQSDVPMAGTSGGAAGTTNEGGVGGGASGGVGGAGGLAAGGADTGGSGGGGGSGAGATGGVSGDGGKLSYSVSGTAQGATGDVVITASSISTGATCGGSACRVPSGGTATLTAPATVGDHGFASWTGAAGCASMSPVVTLSNVTADAACVANYQAVYLVTIALSGGPAGTSITPTSSTPGAICAAGSCRVPSGGVVVASAPALADWFFDGWSGGAVAATSTVTLTDITGSAAITATYINQRQVPCADQPPTNATTASTPSVISTYTTAGGWSTPELCPWTCNTDYCSTGAACAANYLDQIAFTVDTANMWFGGDDRSDIGPRSVGGGQGVTPTGTITMDRFGFNLCGPFRYAAAGTPGSQPNTVELDRRDSSGVIQASYTTTLAADFGGGWVYWNTSPTTLSAGTLYIFTCFLTTAFTQKVNSGICGDQAAGYAGGSGYAGQVTSGDLTSWTSWSPHQWDFDFRVQQHNPACSN